MFHIVVSKSVINKSAYIVPGLLGIGLFSGLFGSCEILSNISKTFDKKSNVVKICSKLREMLMRRLGRFDWHRY